MKRGKIREQKWYPNAVALSIAVVLFVALSHLNIIGRAIAAVFRILYPVIAGVIIAYIINPAKNFFQKRVLKNVANKKLRNTLSLILSVVLMLFLIAMFMTILIPQLYSSVTRFISVIDIYMENLDAFMQKIGISGIGSLAFVNNLLSSSQDMFDAAADFITGHASEITGVAASVGRHIAAWAVGAIIAIYFLADSDRVKVALGVVLKGITKSHYQEYRRFFGKSHAIISRYIVGSIIEAIIVGSVNAILMRIFGMSYIGLVSLVVGVTNLIPVFGPIVGAVVGGFILLLVNPVHALIFIIFTIILQVIDGYIFKPKFFGGTFGVSGLWILIAIVIGGRIAGMAGIILAIPTVAIIDLGIKTWKGMHPLKDKNVRQSGEAIDCQGSPENINSQEPPKEN